jgi:hypothetical protein
MSFLSLGFEGEGEGEGRERGGRGFWGNGSLIYGGLCVSEALCTVGGGRGLDVRGG